MGRAKKTDGVFWFGHPEGLPDVPFKLPITLCQERQLAAVLGSLSCATLKARVSPTIFGVDASPGGAGMVSCAVGQAVVQELLRRADGRGFHTRLLAEVSSYLRTVGLGSEEPSFLISADYGNPDSTLNQTSLNKELTLPSCCHAPFEFTAAARVIFNRFALASLSVRNLGVRGLPLGLFGIVFRFSWHLSKHFDCTCVPLVSPIK